MTDRLTRSLVVLEREAYEAQTKMEQLRADPGKFWAASRAAGSDRSENLEPGDLNKELSRAFSTVDDARTEYSQQRSRLEATADEHDSVPFPETGERLRKQ